jgi:hypothetical protein
VSSRTPQARPKALVQLCQVERGLSAVAETLDEAALGRDEEDIRLRPLF